MSYNGITHRSLLIPKCLINTKVIEHNATYSILTMKPVPTHIIASEDQIHVFGLPPSKVPRDFTSLIKNVHTVEENDRIVSDILPLVMQLQNNEDSSRSNGSCESW